MKPARIKAMVLAAGKGTRLKPFTDSHPKALFEADGFTLLEHALRHLNHHGIRDVVINVHHFSDQILEYLDDNGNFGMNITISDETAMLMETGGGVRRAEAFLSDCDAFIVRNVDILSDMDLTAMLRIHLAAKPLATLAVRNRVTSRFFLFDEAMRLCGWMNRKTGEERIPLPRPHLLPLAFSGIQALSPAVFPLITEKGPFSLTDLYIRLCPDHVIHGYEDISPYWRDAGKPESTNKESR